MKLSRNTKYTLGVLMLAPFFYAFVAAIGYLLWVFITAPTREQKFMAMFAAIGAVLFIGINGWILVLDNHPDGEIE